MSTRQKYTDWGEDVVRMITGKERTPIGWGSSGDAIPHDVGWISPPAKPAEEKPTRETSDAIGDGQASDTDEQHKEV